VTQAKRSTHTPGREIAKRIYNKLPADAQAAEGARLRITPAQLRNIVEQTAAPDLLEAAKLLLDLLGRLGKHKCYCHDTLNPDKCDICLAEQAILKAESRIKNLGSLPPGTGAHFLRCLIGEGKDLIAHLGTARCLSRSMGIWYSLSPSKGGNRQ